jgi:hypothetical protein
MGESCLVGLAPLVTLLPAHQVYSVRRIVDDRDAVDDSGIGVGFRIGVRVAPRPDLKFSAYTSEPGS